MRFALVRNFRNEVKLSGDVSFSDVILRLLGKFCPLMYFVAVGTAVNQLMIHDHT